MKPFNHLSSAVFPLLLIVGCTPVESRDFFPDDGLDDAEELQAEIDATAAMGGGTVALDNGTYNLSRPVYLRDNVALQGKGPATILTNEGLNKKTTWGGVTLFAGNLSAASFTYNGGRGYPGYGVKKIDTSSVRFLNCPSPTSAPVAGNLVWLASVIGEKGSGGWHRPYAGDMHLVTSVSDCTVSFADPVTISEAFDINLHGANKAEVDTRSVGQYRPIKRASVRDVQLRSDSSQALLSSGCYDCQFTGLTIGRSRWLLAVQGMRNSLYSDIQGAFGERGIEFAMFATENVIENISGLYERREGYKMRPVLRWGENARGNLVQNVVLNLTDAVDRAYLIRFDESSDNTLSDITLMVNDKARPATFIYRSAGAEKAQIGHLPDGTTLRRVRQCLNTGVPVALVSMCEMF